MAEERTFEQRFGKRCFCGENWSSTRRCGDRDPAHYTIQDALKLIFADRTGRCEICDAHIPASRKFCYDCAASRQRARDTAKQASWRERHQISKTCEHCSKTYSTHKPEQRYCSLSCGNLARQQKVKAAV